MVHEAAAVGYQRESSTYAKARPSYHLDVIDAVAARIGSGKVVDLGAGTGISTAALVDRGLDVVAVEPVQAMRTERTALLPSVPVLDGTAESIPVDDASIDVVVVAQAFHWFDHGPALEEITRVLAPGGQLITLWNVRDESVPWMAAYTAIQDRVQGDTPRYRDMKWRRSIEADARFALADEVQRSNPQPSSADRTIDRFLSTSFIAQLDRQTQQQLESEIRALVADLGAEYDFPYWTEAQFWTLL